MSLPDDEEPPLKPLIGRGFWVLMGFSLAAVVAGLLVAFAVPNL